MISVQNQVLATDFTHSVQSHSFWPIQTTQKVVKANLHVVKVFNNSFTQPY